MAEQTPRTARGHEEPFAVHFSVFIANRVGQLKDLLNLLGNNAVGVLGLTIVDSTDWGVVRIITSDPGKTRELLKAHHLPFTEGQVILAEQASANSLAEICGVLLLAEINVQFVYPLTIRRNDNPILAIHVDDQVLAVRTLAKHGFTLLGHEDLGEPA